MKARNSISGFARSHKHAERIHRALMAQGFTAEDLALQQTASIAPAPARRPPGMDTRPMIAGAIAGGTIGFLLGCTDLAADLPPLLPSRWSSALVLMTGFLVIGALAGAAVNMMVRGRSIRAVAESTSPPDHPQMVCVTIDVDCPAKISLAAKILLRNGADHIWTLEGEPAQSDSRRSGADDNAAGAFMIRM